MKTKKNDRFTWAFLKMKENKKKRGQKSGKKDKFIVKKHKI